MWYLQHGFHFGPLWESLEFISCLLLLPAPIFVGFLVTLIDFGSNRCPKWRPFFLRIAVTGRFLSTRGPHVAPEPLPTGPGRHNHSPIVPREAQKRPLRTGLGRHNHSQIVPRDAKKRRRITQRRLLGAAFARCFHKVSGTIIARKQYPGLENLILEPTCIKE